MAKKKKSRRKFQQRVHRTGSVSQSTAPAAAGAPVNAAASTISQRPAGASPGVAIPATTPAAALSPGTSGRWIYVAQDLRRVALFALVCIGLEAIAWVVLNHTGVGPAIFNSLNI